MRNAPLALAALALASAAQAQPAAPAAAASAPSATSLEKVEVQGRRDDPTEMRRNASAAKIVIGRQEI